MSCCQGEEELRRLVQSIARAFSFLERDQMGCCGLTPQQAHTLVVIDGTPGISMKALSDQLGIATSTLTRNIEKLEREGSVSRERASNDARAVEVNLTEGGRERLAQVQDSYGTSFNRIMAEIAPEDREVVLRGLTILMKAVRKCCGC